MKKLVLCVLSLVFLGLLIAVCQGPAHNPSPTPGPTAESKPSAEPIGKAVLWCPDCADIGMKINLWNSPQRSQVVGMLPHKTTVTMLEKGTHDGRILYRVSGKGQSGWVTVEFLKW
jgi:hypothetical protein